VLQQQCLEYRSQVISLRTQLDTSQAVQKDFVHLSQSLQVLDQHEDLTLLIRAVTMLDFSHHSYCGQKNSQSLYIAISVVISQIHFYSYFTQQT